ncbi:hypothetical protein ABZ876_08125 [Streptomyces sp. NPDC046931]|uniref:hypothetical protein n=1 Tax=Streptomyces sp. NPDC046931 TaxID=3154806 RepID=UPI0033C2B616
MSIADYLPRIGLFDRTAPRHRAIDEVGRLRHQLAGAEIYMAGQRIQIEDAEQERDDAIERRDIAEKALAQAEAVIRLRDQTIAQLERRLDIACRANAAADLTQELDTSSLRDNYAAGVLTLQQAHCIGPVTDPGRTQ